MSKEDAEGLLDQFEQLRGALDDLKEKIARLESHLGETGSRLQESVLRAEPAGAPGVDVSYVNAAFQQLALGKTQEEILERFLQETQAHVPRAILFFNKETQYVPWKSLGFASDAIQTISAGDPQDPIVRAAEQKRIIYRGESLDQVLPWLRDAGPLPHYCICIPLVFEEFVPIVFYGDAPEPISIDSLELLSHLTILVLKNHYLQTLAGQAAEAPTPEPGPPPAVRPEEEPQPEGAPLKAAEILPPPAPEPPPSAPPQAATVAPIQPPELSFASPESEREETRLDFEQEISLAQEEEFEMEEAGVQDDLSAFEWSPATEEPAESPAPEPWEQEKIQPPATEAAPEPLSEEEERYHQEARRFARLLVSEIKLYNEAEVEKGRLNRDLYSRLQHDVDRSRDMYERRVNPLVSSKIDYFHEEMVRLLAKGDESLLGAGYPGRMLR